MRAALLWVFLLGMALASCRPSPTALRVEVDADPGLAGYVQMVRVRVYDPPWAAHPVEQHDVVVGGALRWPLAFNVMSGDAKGHVRVDVDGFREPASDPDAVGIVRARAIAGFRDGKVLVLPLVFWSACRNPEALDCALDETCSREGRCVHAEVTPEQLQEYMPAASTQGPVCAVGTRALLDACVPSSADAADVVDRPEASGPMDAPVDVPADAPKEMTAPDVPAPSDVNDVVAPDVTVDVGVDVAVDMPVDAGVDAALDVPAELPIDAGVDVPEDVRVDAPDVFVQSGPDVFAQDVAADVRAPTTLRMVQPLAGAILTRRRPLFRWAGEAVGASTWVQVCGDAACARLEGAAAVLGNTWLMGTLLPRGRHWWRISSTSDTGPWTSARMFLVRGTTTDGTSLGTVPDFDSDGYADLVTGLSGFAGAGQVWMYRGSPTGLDIAMPRQIAGPSGTYFGDRIANAGDMNGDGYPDLAVLVTPDSNAVSVQVLPGGPGGVAGAPMFILQPAMRAAGTRFGAAIAGVGDLDGDGYADLAVGQPGTTTSIDLVWIFYGCPLGATPRALSITAPAGMGGHFGAALAPLGDFSNDGVPDFAVAAPDSAGGRVFVFLGGAAIPMLASTFDSPAGAGAAFGMALGGGFDFDGDGLGDLAVGASSAVTNGRVYIYRGAIGLHGVLPDEALLPPIDLTYFGIAVAPGGDIDGDGLDDLLVGHGRQDQIHVFVGAARGLPHPVIKTFQRPSDGTATFTTGYSKALAAFDLNGDDRTDVAFGAGNDLSGAGRVYVHINAGLAGLPAAPSPILPGVGASHLGACIAAQ